MIPTIIQNKNSKILLTMLLALVLATVSSNSIFLAGTPRINTVFIAKVVNLPGTIATNTSNLLASVLTGKNVGLQKDLNQLNSLPSTALQSVGQGVYAKEDQQNKVVYIRVQPDAQWEERTLTINGQRVMVRFPKGTFK